MKYGVMLIILFLLSGCAAIQSTDPYLSINAATNNTNTPQMTDVLPIKLLDNQLTLPLAIKIALANNPEITALGWETTAAEARKKQASSERLPRLSMVGKYTHHLDEQRILPVRQPGEPAILSRDIVSEDLVLSLPLFTGGRLVNHVKTADLLQQAASQRLIRSREELVFNVTSVFNAILAQRHVIESLEFSKEALTKNLEQIDALIAAQKSAKVDGMRTEVRLADIEQRLVQEKNLLSIQHRTLANFLGLKNFQTGIFLQGELEMKERPPVPDLEKALFKAQKSRGDYLAARSSLEAQARNVDIAKSEYWPTIYLQGSYGSRWAASPTSGTGDDVGDEGQIGLLIEIPLFEGGGINAKVREQRANLAAAQERLRKLELQIQLEIETAISNMKSTSERVGAIRKSITQAKESLRIEQMKYELGKGTIVDVLDAQTALLESETTYYRVLAEYHTAMAQLELAMGKK